MTRLELDVLRLGKEPTDVEKRGAPRPGGRRVPA